MRRTSLSETLPGAWLLESRIDLAADGTRHPDPLLGEDPVALLVYDASGYFTAQFMKRDRATALPESAASGTQATPKNNTQAQWGYDAYFGTYTIDDVTGTVTQRLLGALAPANVGMELTRAMQADHQRLVIRLETTAADGVAVTRTLTWRRLGRVPGSGA